MDIEERTVQRHGIEVDLPERSFRLLEALIRRAGRTVSKDTLVKQVWQGSYVSDTSITEAMSRLRDVLGDEARNPSFILTVHGRGYRFIAPIDYGDPAPSRGTSRRMKWLVASTAASVGLIGAAWFGSLLVGGDNNSTDPSAASPTPSLDRPRFRLAEFVVNDAELRDYDFPALPFNDLSIDRTGSRLAFSISNGPQADAWVLEARKGELRRVTHGGHFTDPVWTPDGHSLAMARWHHGSFDLVLKEVDGDGPVHVLLEAPFDQYPESWSQDGKSLIFSENHPETGYDLWILTQDSAGGWFPTPLVCTPDDEAFGAISPDGRYVAFASRTDRHTEVFVVDLRSDRRPVRLSPDGGAYPFWSSSGDRLHYLKGDEVVTVVTELMNGDLTRVARTSSEVPDLRLAVSSSAADRIVVATLDRSSVLINK